MQKVLPNYTIVVIPLASPLLIGVYQDNILIETLKSDKKTSEVLLLLIDDIMKRYSLDKIIYTNGPGSYMATKLSYITLKTIEITKGIPLIGCSAFEMNSNQPIKAIGNLYFIKDKETIITKKFEIPIEQVYSLPNLLNNVKLEKDNRPDYRLRAV